jgi:hypothetical protein
MDDMWVALQSQLVRVSAKYSHPSKSQKLYNTCNRCVWL